jgi:hypothetical protein
MSEPHPLKAIKHIDEYTIDDLNADVLMFSRALDGYLRVVRGAKPNQQEHARSSADERSLSRWQQ